MDEAAPVGDRLVISQHGRFWIDPIVGFFDIATFDTLPFGNWTIKVVQRGEAQFYAFPNVVVFNSQTQCQEHICGMGSTIRDAVVNCIDMFMSEALKQKANKGGGELDEADFVWLNWQPYLQAPLTKSNAAK